MTFLPKIQEPYYYRETKNDDRDQNTSLFTDGLNAACLILPNIFKPLSRPIALSLGAFRATTYWLQKDITKPAQLFSAIVATTAWAATYFGHPLGMLITTAQDLGLELYQLYHVERTRQNLQKIIGHCLNIANDSMYLVNFLKGRIEFTIASLALQVLVEGYKSQQAFITGNRFRGSLHLLTAAFRCNQVKEQIDLSRLIKTGSTFSIIRRLGKGAEGKVFLARRSDNTLIAVKEYHSQKTLYAFTGY